MGELEEMLGACVGVRAGVDQDRGAVAGGDDDRDAGAVDAGKPLDVQKARREHGAGVPGRDDRVRVAVGDGANRADERGVGLAAHRLARLVVHGDDAVGDDVLETSRIEVGRAVEDGRDAGARGLERAGDDLLGSAVAAQGVNGDADGHSRYGAGVPSGCTSRPRYVLHVGQT